MAEQGISSPILISFAVRADSNTVRHRFQAVRAPASGSHEFAAKHANTLDRLRRQTAPPLISHVLIRVAVDRRVANRLGFKARGNVLKAVGVSGEGHVEGVCRGFPAAAGDLRPDRVAPDRGVDALVHIGAATLDRSPGRAVRKAPTPASTESSICAPANRRPTAPSSR